MSDNAKAPKKSFFKGLKAEFKKINWPSTSVIAKESGVVLVITVILAAITACVDWLINLGLDQLFKL